MPLSPHQLELLAPARTAEIGREAILHGADAVYIGGPAFGARTKADNPIEDIAELCEFAHRYHARIFVTLNTILHDEELEPARRLVHALHDAGVDALIVQDMALLEMDLPPIALHASTQCDIRTVERAQFLGDVGFSQLVLARELNLAQIARIRQAVRPEVALEYFVHGALCVAFSGNCYISEAHTGRSANRGSCSQECRLPYTLLDEAGRVVAHDQHLLSMKDNDQSANLRLLIDAGIRSFKIEGRYKDLAYVKNVTAHYRRLLDAILEERRELARASHGQCTFSFTPDPARTFNRGSTDYFTHGRQPGIGAFATPVHAGLQVGEVLAVGPRHIDVRPLRPEDAPAGAIGASSESPVARHADDRHLVRPVPARGEAREVEFDARFTNGDGITWFHGRELVGAQVDRAEPNGVGWRLHLSRPTAGSGLARGTRLHRNRDQAWEACLARPSAARAIPVRMRLAAASTGVALTVSDAHGHRAEAALAGPLARAEAPARAEAAVREALARLGGSVFSLADEPEQAIELSWTEPYFVPASQLNRLRREAIAALEVERASARPRSPRLRETDPPPRYPTAALDFMANVYNTLARRFYERHGVARVDPAYEAHEERGEVPLMVTKHCLRFAFSLCPKQAKGVVGVQGQIRAAPMQLVSAAETLRLEFDCKPCEMHVIGRMRPHIAASPPPRIDAPLRFFPRASLRPTERSTR